MITLQPIVMLDHNNNGLLVFRKGCKYYHAVAAAGGVIRVVSFETLENLRPAERRGKPYPPKRCANIWLHHSDRAITKRARAILRGLVSRKTQAGGEEI